MTLILQRYDTTVRGGNDLVNSLSAAITARHATTPFASTNELVTYLHETWKNPRVKYQSDEEGKTIEVSDVDSKILLLKVVMNP